MVAHGVATGERADHSEGRLSQRRRTHSPAPREAENRSWLPRRVSIQGNLHLDWSGGAGTLERVLHSVEHPRTLHSCAYTNNNCGGGSKVRRHDRHFPLTRLTVQPHQGVHGLWSDVVGRREVRVVEYISVVRMHPFRDALLVCPSAVPSAHVHLRVAL